MFVYLSKKISIPNNVQLRCIAWSKLDGFIACGGDEGLLKVLKLETAGKDGIKGLAAPSNLSINQNLEGHSGSVQVLQWNEVSHKLTTSDQYGLIIVWMLFKGSWYEEMINNRNKSVVTDMAWSSDGTRICIVYEDGVVIVGSVDGNRLWGKEIKGSLIAVEWSPNSQLILFGFHTGEVHTYDNEGNYMSKLPITCINDMENPDLNCICWHHPINGPIEYDEDGNVIAGAVDKTRSVTETAYYGAQSSRPKLALVYKNGTIQLMRHENDADPTMIYRNSLEILSAQWNPEGSMLAVSGKQMDLPEADQNVVYFIGTEGQLYRSLRAPGSNLAGCSWEASGLRVCLAVDSHIFFANLRPQYKWGYCGETVVYTFQRGDRPDVNVVFWDVKLEEIYVKHVRELLTIASYGEYCLLANKADDPSGMYLLQLCNGIGTPVDFKYLDLEPKFVTLNSTHVIVASHDAFYLWNYSVPRKSQREIHVALGRRTSHKEMLYHVDDIVTEQTEPTPDIGKSHLEIAGKERSKDPIKCVCSTDKIFILARESGVIQKYAIPNGVLLHKYNLSTKPEIIALNRSSSRLSVINTVGTMTFYDIDTSEAKLVPNFERKDVWNMVWDEDDDHMIAIMEKTRLFVLKGTEAEEPVINSGYICRFKNLSVRTVLVDELVKKPELPDKEWVMDVEIKALRDAKQLLEKMSIQQASTFIEQNPHPKLWNLLAEVALNNIDTITAEHAYVKLRDYAGIQFIKKINKILNPAFKKAEVLAYFGKFDDAEKIYIDNDRRDLAIALRRKVHDWFKILQLLQTGSGAGDDVLMQEAWNHVGDYFADRQKWVNAARHYEPGRNHEMLVKCYSMTESYDKLESLMNSLPENHKLLVSIGEIFANSGLCEQAVESYKKCNQIRSALDICVQLNQWELAVELARSENMQDIEHLLNKYAAQLTGDSDKTLVAVQLYRKAGRFLDAAKLVFQIADEEREKHGPPLRLKKLYVLAALLIEQYHTQNKTKAMANKGKKNLEAQAALSGLLAEDADASSSVLDSRIIDNAWRGAEAYHFHMMAQRQLIEGNIEAAMKTTLHLTEYDDIIEPIEVYSMLALTSASSRQFSVCSRAFIRLESIENMAPEEKEAYEKLALDIFTKQTPKDNRQTKAECTGCETLIPDYCLSCPQCDTKFPTCIVTGRSLMAYQFWLCPQCKHRAYEQEIQTYKFCPLCHAAIG